MNVAFTGGRHYSNRKLVELIVDSLGSVHCLVGDASGLDALVRDQYWPADEITVFHANWECHGKAAGPIRNREMLQEADLLIAFPGGRGTADCIRQAKELGIPVLRVEE